MALPGCWCLSNYNFWAFLLGGKQKDWKCTSVERERERRVIIFQHPSKPSSSFKACANSIISKQKKSVSFTLKSPDVSKFAKSTSIYHEVSLCSNKTVHYTFILLLGYNYNTLNNTKKRKQRSKLCLLHFGHHTESHEAGRLKREMTNNRSMVCGYSTISPFNCQKSRLVCKPH